MARQLGVGPKVIMSQARRLGLTQSKGGKNGQPECRVSRRAGKRIDLDETERTMIYRQQWQRAVEENPAAGRKALRKIEPAAYEWLIRRDAQWFDAASPPYRPRPKPRPIVDWKQRDADFAAAARIAAENLKQTPGRPVWITKTAIAKAIRALATVTNRAHLLPLTISVLEKLSETIEEWAIRRILWAADCFRRENRQVSSAQLTTRAAVSNAVASRPEVQPTLIEVLRELRMNKME
jgi:Tn7-like transposition protein D